MSGIAVEERWRVKGFRYRLAEGIRRCATTRFYSGRGQSCATPAKDEVSGLPGRQLPARAQGKNPGDRLSSARRTDSLACHSHVTTCASEPPAGLVPRDLTRGTCRENRRPERLNRQLPMARPVWEAKSNTKPARSAPPKGTVPWGPGYLCVVSPPDIIVTRRASDAGSQTLLLRRSGGTTACRRYCAAVSAHTAPVPPAAPTTHPSAMGSVRISFPQCLEMSDRDHAATSHPAPGVGLLWLTGTRVAGHMPPSDTAYLAKRPSGL